MDGSGDRPSGGRGKALLDLLKTKQAQAKEEPTVGQPTSSKNLLDLLKSKQQQDSKEEPKVGQPTSSTSLLDLLKSKQQPDIKEETKVSQPTTEPRLLDVLKLKQAQKNNEEPKVGQAKPDTPSPTPSGDSAILSSGRGKLLQMLQKPQAAQSSISPTTISTPSSTPPLPYMGRGSLLSLASKLTESTGHSSQSPKEELTAKTPLARGAAIPTKAFSNLSIDSGSQVSASSDPISRQGFSGKPIDITANYIDLVIEPGKGIFRYEVKFSPEVDAIYLRRKLLNQHAEALGITRNFDGALLYLPIRLPNDRTMYESINPGDGSTVTITLIFQTQQRLADSIHFFNSLLGRVMRSLKLVRIGRDDFNPRCAHAVPEHRMELWPGYVTAIDEYEGGLKLNINASHRVMRTDTVRDFISEIYKKNPGNMREMVNAEILGLTVLTRYNNRTYRIDDIDWDKTPMWQFERKGENIVVAEYYKSHWNIQIKDLKQPLLVSRRQEKTSTGETRELQTLLVPELCYLSGLTDKIRSDFRIMRSLASITQVNPTDRRDIILRFVQDVKNTPLAVEILSGWGLKLADDTTRLKGRVLDPEDITFGNNVMFKSDRADWGGAAVKNPMFRTPHMQNWCIISTDRDNAVAREFVSMLRRVGKQMSMNISEPNYIKLQGDRTENYLTAIKKNLNPKLEMVVTLCPSNRSDRYAAIKKLCCVESPVRSQVIITKTISRGDKLKSVTEKIALQMNCKLGGALWALKIPFDNCMMCGIDVYHAGPGEKSKGSVAAFVASTNKSLTSWYSRVCFQRANQELVDLLKICLVASIKAYSKANVCYPERIIIYRDGVGDGQLDTVANYEVKQLQQACSTIDESYKPNITVIVVQKRVNTRLIANLRGKLENPPPGTVVDSIVTRRNWYDFFLIPQTSRQGTVSPTHYVVIYDGAGMKTDHIQRLSFKLCHLYYNWPGTVKVPAPCQYAHKLAYLVGQSIGMQPSETLANSLYYL